MISVCKRWSGKRRFVIGDGCSGDSRLVNVLNGTSCPVDHHRGPRKNPRAGGRDAVLEHCIPKLQSAVWKKYYPSTLPREGIIKPSSLEIIVTGCWQEVDNFLQWSSHGLSYTCSWMQCNGTLSPNDKHLIKKRTTEWERKKWDQGKDDKMQGKYDKTHSIHVWKCQIWKSQEQGWASSPQVVGQQDFWCTQYKSTAPVLAVDRS